MLLISLLLIGLIAMVIKNNRELNSATQAQPVKIRVIDR